MKSTAIFFSFVMIVLFAVLGTNLCDYFGLNANSEIERRYLYMFSHGSWIHLSINIYSLLVIFFLAGGNWWQSLFSLAVSIYLPSFVLPEEQMIVGASTFIYCMTGILVMNSEKRLLFILMNSLFIMFSFMLPSSNIAVIPHLYCFVCGLLFGILTARIHG